MGSAAPCCPQNLAVQIEFNDRYSQASTYGQLGLLAESQEQWTQAQQYLFQALQIFHEFHDEHSIEKVMSILARLYEKSGDAGLPAAVATVLGVGVEELQGFHISKDEEELQGFHIRKG